ncbi:glycosyltransferase family 2 protein [Aurantiacibacter gangjinensis]|uniref:glycosyltransferase family 2 protein n=1 Tax=Aurantiacibacter gangjinensis TaxID=502682 RepID=UPI00069B779B|nr:glycosyltransferase family 2 protein [Aurantiacibacter gangjinensis]APE29149.1 Alpha-L-Rha alpha-1,3-L-rhamnosyltransferase [Aurantiacibacter gangjinensis]
MSRIDILLATYNGAKFLPEQLASLEAQTHTDWRLLARDDGSSDGSLDIVRAWARGVSQSVEIIEDGHKGLGASLNFATLLQHSDAPYFACCDQDDQWLPEKLEVMLAAVQEQEASVGADIPLLAFCDQIIAAENLSTIDNSAWEKSRISCEPDDLRPASLLVRNVVTGCASLGNAALRQMSLPIPGGARMHDWWLALVAASFGELVPVRKALLRYRQHGLNTIGALDAGTVSLMRRFVQNPTAELARARRARDNSQRQARAFSERFADGGVDASIMAEYARLPERSALRRKAFIIRHGIGRGSPLFFIALLIVV